MYVREAKGPRRAGVSLTEVVASAMMSGIVLVGALNMVSGVLRSDTVTSGQLAGPALAEALIAEIQGQPVYDDLEPGLPLGLEAGESGTTRADFDDIDDYDGWTASPPQAKDGTPLTAFTGWTREVDVMHSQVLIPDLPNLLGDSGLRRIEVTVTDPGGRTVTLYTLRSLSGMLEQSLPVDVTVVRSLEATLLLDGANTSIRGGTNLNNHASGP